MWYCGIWQVVAVWSLHLALKQPNRRSVFPCSINWLGVKLTRVGHCEVWTFSIRQSYQVPEWIHSHTHIYIIRLVLVSIMLYYCFIEPLHLLADRSTAMRTAQSAKLFDLNRIMGKKWKNTDVGWCRESGKLYKEWNDVKRTLYATGITTSSNAEMSGIIGLSQLWPNWETDPSPSYPLPYVTP